MSVVMAELEDEACTLNEPIAFYLLVSQMLAGKKAIEEEIEIWEIKDIAFIPIDKKEIQRPIHIIML